LSRNKWWRSRLISIKLYTPLRKVSEVSFEVIFKAIFEVISGDISSEFSVDTIGVVTGKSLVKPLQKLLYEELNICGKI
jgi:hypothetical protein